MKNKIVLTAFSAKCLGIHERSNYGTGKIV
jgi:hypothetical protein